MSDGLFFLRHYRASKLCQFNTIQVATSGAYWMCYLLPLNIQIAIEIKLSLIALYLFLTLFVATFLPRSFCLSLALAVALASCVSTTSVALSSTRLGSLAFLQNTSKRKCTNEQSALVKLAHNC